jgi:hypothetical protein
LLDDLARQRVVWLSGHEGKIGWPDFGAAVEDHGANVGGAVDREARPSPVNRWITKLN